MKQIKLHFPNNDYLTQLLNDESFMSSIFYLKPNRINENNILLYENEDYHSDIETEITILALFASAINRIIFMDTNINVEYINPLIDQMKTGLKHNIEIIIDSIEIINL